MSKRKKKPRFKPGVVYHECEGSSCSRLVELRFRFCQRCAGHKGRRPNIDLLDVRVPGSYGSGKA